MILYYPTKFHFNTALVVLEIWAAGTFRPPPSPRAQAPKKIPGRIGLKKRCILVQ